MDIVWIYSAYFIFILYKWNSLSIFESLSLLYIPDIYIIWCYHNRKFANIVLRRTMISRKQIADVSMLHTTSFMHDKENHGTHSMSYLANRHGRKLNWMRWPIEIASSNKTQNIFGIFFHAVEWLNVWCLTQLNEKGPNGPGKREGESETVRDEKHKICYCSKRFSTQNFLLCNKRRREWKCSSSFTLLVDRMNGFHCWCAVSSVSCSLHPDNVAHSNLHYACRTLDV